jgi:hypothetical protein
MFNPVNSELQLVIQGDLYFSFHSSLNHFVVLFMIWLFKEMPMLHFLVSTVIHVYVFFVYCWKCCKWQFV